MTTYTEKQYELQMQPHMGKFVTLYNLSIMICVYYVCVCCRERRKRREEIVATDGKYRYNKVPWVSAHGRLNITCNFGLHGRLPRIKIPYISIEAATVTP